MCVLVAVILDVMVEGRTRDDESGQINNSDPSMSSTRSNAGTATKYRLPENTAGVLWPRNRHPTSGYIDEGGVRGFIRPAWPPISARTATSRGANSCRTNVNPNET